MKKVAKKGILEAQGMYLTTEEAAKYLAMSKRTLENLRSKNTGPEYIRTHDNKLLYRRSELLAWRYRFEKWAVKCSEAKIKVKDPLIDYDLHFEGAEVEILADNAGKAVKRITEEIIKNSVDGFLCFEYSCCGIKAQLHINDVGILFFARYFLLSDND